jgi:hypothetical protein
MTTSTVHQHQSPRYSYLLSLVCQDMMGKKAASRISTTCVQLHTHTHAKRSSIKSPRSTEVVHELITFWRTCGNVCEMEQLSRKLVSKLDCSRVSLVTPTMAIREECRWQFDDSYSRECLGCVGCRIALLLEWKTAYLHTVW